MSSNYFAFSPPKLYFPYIPSRYKQQFIHLLLIYHYIVMPFSIIYFFYSAICPFLIFVFVCFNLIFINLFLLLFLNLLWFDIFSSKKICMKLLFLFLKEAVDREWLYRFNFLFYSSFKMIYSLKHNNIVHNGLKPDRY